MSKPLNNSQSEDLDANTEVVQQVRKNPQHIGTIRKIAGLILYEFNPEKMTLEPAEYKETIGSIKGKVIHKLVAKEGCIYVQALNKKNAYKKIAKSTRKHK